MIPLGERLPLLLPTFNYQSTPWQPWAATAVMGASLYFICFLLNKEYSLGVKKKPDEPLKPLSARTIGFYVTGLSMLLMIFDEFNAD